MKGTSKVVTSNSQNEKKEVCYDESLLSATTSSNEATEAVLVYEVNNNGTENDLITINGNEDQEETCNQLNEQISSKVASSPIEIAQSRRSQNDAIRIVRKKKRRTRAGDSFCTGTFDDLYYITGDHLGEGAYATVWTCVNRFTHKEYAVKMIDKHIAGHSRKRVFKEVELLHKCANTPNILQLIEYFENNDHFYLVFEKMYGGTLLHRIEQSEHFDEMEAAKVVKDIATALAFLHDNGIAHRDLKPANILCVTKDKVNISKYFHKNLILSI